MNVVISLAIVAGIFLLGFLGASAGLGVVFGVLIPYIAAAVFIGGMVYRIWSWASSPVPFRIPTTCGQQKSLPWIKAEPLENPSNTWGVVGRMILEVCLFRSLLRNTRTEIVGGRRLAYRTDLALWLGAIAMHVTLLIIIIRHLRLFINPVPFPITLLLKAEAIHYLGAPAPVLFVTAVVFVAALAYLLARRLASPQVRYISLVSDYFPLFLLLSIAISGLFLRHIARTDIGAIKTLILGLVTFHPTMPTATIAPLFFGHLFLVCALLIYFPFSKLTHVAGVFLSPTRNMANTNRMVHHVNPWDYPVKEHTYEEYENELRDKMKAAGIPVEKE